MPTFVKIKNLVGEWHSFIGSSLGGVVEYLEEGAYYAYLGLDLSTAREIPADQAGSPEVVKEASAEYSNYVGERYFGVKPDPSRKYGTPAFATNYIGKVPSPSSQG